ncbi:hypothetical protein [Mesorhizobium sp.]|uniref:hypothetical protein n=1 Tax=Mesorhizobium sp. TaxID=1871066 RepID=UPI000FEA2898|nr:hypothetical protein [Mesorhizobium sp.]RWC58560.1 MAG: hypothetical protein EOS29_23150 [Mesorhizobium sp.]RWC62160.1 MAG: hypothetical protein EOS56_09095 [Mesorhizobium sp.]
MDNINIASLAAEAAKSALGVLSYRLMHGVLVSSPAQAAGRLHCRSCRECSQAADVHECRPSKAAKPGLSTI